MSRPTRGRRVPVSRTGLSPAMARLSRRFRYQNTQATGLVRFRSPLLAESRLMSFPPATEMFQFAGFASRSLWIQLQDTRLRGGLPHSEIPGSTIARISPGLFAACHVLHRLSVPRHPPDALTSRLSATPNGKNPDQMPEIRHQGSEPVRVRQTSPYSEDTLCRTPPTAPPAHAGRTANGLPLRSHNSLLYDCRQQMPRASPSGDADKGMSRVSSYRVRLEHQCPVA